MKILVTGGAGYLGTSLVNLLDNQSEVEEVIVYDNLSCVHSNFFLGTKKLKKTRFIKGDVLNSFELEKVVSDVSFIYHLAAYTAFPQNHTDNLRYEQINQWGTVNLIQAVKNVSNIRKFIYLSSATVYGNLENIKEDFSPQPQSPYSVSKYAGEKYLASLNSHCECLIVRAGNIFGFNSSYRLDSVVNNFIFQSIVQKSISILGNGQQQRAFVEIDYLCKCLIELLSQVDNKIQTIANFNASLVEIKNIILEKIPDLEYQFLNQNINYGGFTLHESLLKEGNMKARINHAIDSFDNNLRL